MSNYSRNVATAEHIRKISIGYLFQIGLIKKDCNIEGYIYWKNGNSLKIKSSLTDTDKWIELIYNYNSNEINYKVYLIPVESNLGIGNIYYFECPETKRKCRVLYQCYGSETFKSRYAYKKRIYYKSQCCSKSNYSFERYFALSDTIQALDNSRMKKIYRGRVTETYKRYMRLKERQNFYDKLRLEAMLKTIQDIKKY